MGRMHANVYALLENAELVGCVDRRTEKAEAFAKDFGCPVFASIEEAVQATGANVVDVCLPKWTCASRPWTTPPRRSKGPNWAAT